MEGRKLTVDFHYLAERPYQFQVYHRCLEALRNRGITCRFFPNGLVRAECDSDVFVVQHPSLLGGNAQKLSQPIIIEEREDISMPACREMLTLPNVVRCFKISVVRNDWVNLPNRYPNLWLLENQATRSTHRLLTHGDVAKLKPGIHSACSTECRRGLSGHAEGKTKTRGYTVR